MLVSCSVNSVRSPLENNILYYFTAQSSKLIFHHDFMITSTSVTSTAELRTYKRYNIDNEYDLLSRAQYQNCGT